MQVDLGDYLLLSTLIFGIGGVGFFTRRNILIQLMSIELMLNAVNLCFVSFNRWYAQDHQGQLFAFFVIAIAAAEAAVGLAILINLFRIRETVQGDEVRDLKH